MKTGQMYIGGEWIDGAGTFVVSNKFTGEPVATVQSASREQVAQAVRAAASAFTRLRLTPYARYEILHRAAGLVESRRRDFVSSIVGESGFTVSDAEVEVSRTVQTFLLCAEEAKRITGEVDRKSVV